MMFDRYMQNMRNNMAVNTTTLDGSSMNEGHKRLIRQWIAECESGLKRITNPHVNLRALWAEVPVLKLACDGDGDGE